MFERPRKRTRVLIPLSTALALLLAAGAYVYVDRQRHTAPGEVARASDNGFAKPGSVPIGGDFTRVNDQGEAVTAEDYADAYKLVFFGFTHCHDIWAP